MADPVEFLTNALSQTGADALPYAEHQKWTLRQHLADLLSVGSGSTQLSCVPSVHAAVRSLALKTCYQHRTHVLQEFRTLHPSVQTYTQVDGRWASRRDAITLLVLKDLITIISCARTAACPATRGPEHVNILVRRAVKLLRAQGTLPMYHQVGLATTQGQSGGMSHARLECRSHSAQGNPSVYPWQLRRATNTTSQWQCGCRNGIHRRRRSCLSSPRRT
jgi:hypothetical protein